ncbi:site-specific DNA-methyltransferase [Sphingopyxis sp. BSN-002]|uniref:site-specific DNA-methyltransferase n=1 Tax=Sphingopyxis sp. BSN-002 TaxID=2911495 RepID=UPI001EDC631F|nr:DNA methyltransferase [Sphingopyxis sp. BSN-002]UKK86194.1 site-specific DNA-methyltransferase [Sphingopyxis sp. BSN-002]
MSSDGLLLKQGVVMKKLSPIENAAVERRLLADLIPFDRNARTHSKRQIDQIAKSIERFGFVNPVLVDDEGRVVAGHGRIEAARRLGLTDVPVLSLGAMSDADRRAYIIADNRLAELAGWDRDLLTSELGELQSLLDDIDFECLGFDQGELDAMLALGDDDGDAADAVPEVDEAMPVVSRSGDIWMMGRHRLICGDSRDPAVFDHLMAGKKAAMVFTDPPYNVPVNGHICGLGSVKHDEFAMAAGEMSAAEFTAFLETVLGNVARASCDGSIHYVCMDWRHMRELLDSGDAVYSEFKNLIVWNKDNGGMGSFYRSKHELVFAFKNGTATHINNFGLGEKGRYRTNVWDYAGVNSLKKDRAEELAMHPTVKPVAMVADAIRDCSNRGDVILDAFSGSGTTIVAAEQTGRCGYAVEFDPKYVDVAVRRWQALTGGKAVLDGTSDTFDDSAALADL